MCGIIGLITKDETTLSHDKIKLIIDDLLLVSQSRGKDSSGIAFLTDNEILVYKEPKPAKEFIKTKIYKEILDTELKKYAIIGHARMETNGSFSLTNNNQPIIKDGLVTIHNGIIVNDSEIWKDNKDITRQYEVDTEAFNSLFRKNINKYNDILNALNFTLSQLKGSYSFGSFFSDYDHLLLVTNTGSLYTLTDKQNSFLIFASEKIFLDQLIFKHFPDSKEDLLLTKIQPLTGILINIRNLDITNFQTKVKSIKVTKLETKKRTIKLMGEEIKFVDLTNAVKNNTSNNSIIEKLIFDEYSKNKEIINNLKRCRKCILPETMPFISFDKDGVCNYCHNHQTREVRGLDKLEQDVKPYRKNSNQADCIVSFSGGRDSCYALHYVKKELGLNPVAYSYDWGMLTDLGRRNQARMTGQLGVEHILISADIQKKRDYIRKNVSAWLEKPNIGMVPLFMAGDKQYFYHLNKLRKETGIQLVVYADNSLEKTDFKYGFANIHLDSGVGKAYKIGRMNSLRLLWFYASNYIKNPKYLNSSLIDTFTAYMSSYATPKDYVYIYRYFPWTESVIEDTLLNQYDWELSPDTKSSWRIGDGTASFYNYIYYIVTGLTENDTFRSNQIREGLITREAALEKSIEENVPRIESILWYCNTIGLDAKYAIQKINHMRKLYK